MSEVLNVRVGEGFKELAVRAAARDHLLPSPWAKEVLMAVVAAGVTLPELQRLLESRQEVDPAVMVAQVRVSGELGRSEHLTGRCLHPVHLRERLPTHDRCGGCGRRMDRVGGWVEP